MKKMNRLRVNIRKLKTILFAISLMFLFVGTALADVCPTCSAEIPDCILECPECGADVICQEDPDGDGVPDVDGDI